MPPDLIIGNGAMEQWSNGVTIFFVFLLGLIIGSFINCLLWRVYKGESVGGRSYCPGCGHKISWYDNIPLLSYFLLKGRCRACHDSISIQYPLVELASGILFVAVYLFYLHLHPGWSMGLFFEIIRGWFIVSVLIFIFVFDLRWYLIPDKVILPSILLILAFDLGMGADWPAMAFSAIIGAGFFLAQFLISQGRWIGGGDIRLGLFMGLVLGEYKITILALFLAYLIGSLAVLFLLVTGKKTWGQRIPFGIFLTVATIIALFWGGSMVDWYLGYLGF
jgi:prepilin signal peptidase PulO-like enzyme (type II secretory pathway)